MINWKRVAAIAVFFYVWYAGANLREVLRDKCVTSLMGHFGDTHRDGDWECVFNGKGF